MGFLSKSKQGNVPTAIPKPEKDIGKGGPPAGNTKSKEKESDSEEEEDSDSDEDSEESMDEELQKNTTRNAKVKEQKKAKRPKAQNAGSGGQSEPKAKNQKASLAQQQHHSESDENTNCDEDLEEHDEEFDSDEEYGEYYKRKLAQKKGFNFQTITNFHHHAIHWYWQVLILLATISFLLYCIPRMLSPPGNGQQIVDDNGKLLSQGKTIDASARKDLQGTAESDALKGKSQEEIDLIKKKNVLATRKAFKRAVNEQDQFVQKISKELEEKQKQVNEAMIVRGRLQASSNLPDDALASVHLGHLNSKDDDAGVNAKAVYTPSSNRFVDPYARNYKTDFDKIISLPYLPMPMTLSFDVVPETPENEEQTRIRQQKSASFSGSLAPVAATIRLDSCTFYSDHEWPTEGWFRKGKTLTGYTLKKTVQTIAYTWPLPSRDLDSESDAERGASDLRFWRGRADAAISMYSQTIKDALMRPGLRISKSVFETHFLTYYGVTEDHKNHWKAVSDKCAKCDTLTESEVKQAKEAGTLDDMLKRLPDKKLKKKSSKKKGSQSAGDPFECYLKISDVVKKQPPGINCLEVVQEIMTDVAKTMARYSYIQQLGPGNDDFRMNVRDGINKLGGLGALPSDTKKKSKKSESDDNDDSDDSTGSSSSVDINAITTLNPLVNQRKNFEGRIFLVKFQPVTYSQIISPLNEAKLGGKGGVKIAPELQHVDSGIDIDRADADVDDVKADTDAIKAAAKASLTSNSDSDSSDTHPDAAEVRDNKHNALAVYSGSYAKLPGDSGKGTKPITIEQQTDSEFLRFNKDKHKGSNGVITNVVLFSKRLTQLYTTSIKQKRDPLAGSGPGSADIDTNFSNDDPDGDSTIGDDMVPIAQPLKEPLLYITYPPGQDSASSLAAETLSTSVEDQERAIKNKEMVKKKTAELRAISDKQAKAKKNSKGSKAAAKTTVTTADESDDVEDEDSDSSKDTKNKASESDEDTGDMSEDDDNTDSSTDDESNDDDVNVAPKKKTPKDKPKGSKEKSGKKSKGK